MTGTHETDLDQHPTAAVSAIVDTVPVVDIGGLMQQEHIGPRDTAVQQIADVDRPDEVHVSPAPQRLYGGLYVFDTGDYQYLAHRLSLLDVADQVEPALPQHLHIEEHNLVIPFGRKLLQGLLPAESGDGLMPGIVEFPLQA